MILSLVQPRRMPELTLGNQDRNKGTQVIYYNYVFPKNMSAETNNDFSKIYHNLWGKDAT